MADVKPKEAQQLDDKSGVDGDADSDCVFCKILSKKAEAEILYEDSDFICFVDRKPASLHHFLVIPRQHIQDPRVLRSSHIPLIEQMAEIGKQVLEQQGGKMEDARVGFHWPPFILVKHLHLHVISPESSMGWFNRNVIFRKNSYFFTSPSYMLEYLRTKN